MKVLVRPAKEIDIPCLTEIFNYHVRHGYSTFRVEPESVEQRMKVFGQSSLTGPYRMLVAEVDGEVIGTARSFRYRESPVFDRTVETGIYLNHKIMGKGIGSQLYQSLFDILSKENLHLAVAGIALPNEGSVALHKKFGFKNVGVFDEYAYFGGKYHSSIWMQKKVGILNSAPV